MFLRSRSRSLAGSAWPARGALAALSLVTACSESDGMRGGSDAGAGGIFQGSGGAGGTSGAGGAGGSTGTTGGSPGSGGTVGTGGAGGTISTGGTLNTGGVNTGGVLGTGGSFNTGGMIGTGGAGGSEPACDLPATYSWRSSGPLVSPKSNATHNLVSVKDPTIIFHDGLFQVYATTANTAGHWSMVHFSFADFDQAGAAPHYYMDATPGFGGYHCAPHLFYFEPQGLWYLIQQAQPPQYSTSTDPSDPTSWTAPKWFYPNGNHLPAGAPSLPIDYWIICDDAKCHLFFTGDNGKLYRAETSIGDFPNGFGTLHTVLSESQFAIFEGSSHYKVKGKNQYLTVIEAIGGGGRYFRSWTSTALEGPWTPLATTEQSPFAGARNVSYEAGVADWTNDVSHGELIRDGVDQTQTIDACNLRFFYQGRSPSSDGMDYSQLPYRLGLLTLDQ